MGCSLKTKQLANSNWQLARKPQQTIQLQPSADWDSAHPRAKAAREWGPDWDWAFALIDG